MLLLILLQLARPSISRQDLLPIPCMDSTIFKMLLGLRRHFHEAITIERFHGDQQKLTNYNRKISW